MHRHITKLRKLIKDDVRSALRESKKSSLRTSLREDAAEDLEKWMNTPLKSLGSDPTKSLSADAKELVKKGQADGSPDDDKKITGSTSGGGESIAVTQIKASQNEVGMAQSLANVCKGVNGMSFDGIDYGDVDWLVKAMKPGASITFAAPILGASTSDGNVVLDGHHRWSQAFMINPDCKVNVVFLSAGDISADETLKAVHLAILAKTGGSKTKSAKGGNLFQAGASDVAGYLDASDRKVDPKTGKPSGDGVPPYVYAVMKLNDITDPAQGKEAAINRIMNAVKKCAETVVGGAPDRAAMPQADSETNPVSAADVAAALSSGDVNYVPPFGGGGTSTKKPENASRLRSGEVVVERWQKLAGLIK